MKRREVFCEHCRKDVLYIKKDECMGEELKGETYNYYGEVAVNNECSNEIFVNEIND